MNINAERLAARVHDALTRDYNENHDEHRRFASGEAAKENAYNASSRAMAASRVAKTAEINQFLSRSGGDKYLDKARSATTHMGPLHEYQDHLDAAADHKMHTQLGDIFPSVAAAHNAAAAAHLEAAKAYLNPEFRDENRDAATRVRTHHVIKSKFF